MAKSAALNTAHEIANDLYEAKIIDSITMRKFDEICLPKVHNFKPLEIKQLRLREKLSQTVFAKYLNISPSTVRSWEQGEKHPQGSSLKLLNLIAKKGIKILV